MKTYIKRREKNTQLIVFYSAWGTDEKMLTPLCNDDFDFILFYNYSADEALILPEMKKYERVILIAWSLGVWAAEYLFPKTGIKPDISIAVNGTPLPAHDTYGIPQKIIEGTLNNITEESKSKFYLRMFGDKTTFELNQDRVPVRSLKSLHDELRWLYNGFMEQNESGLRWDYAVISEDDRVFPSRSLRAYWDAKKDTEKITLPFPHYFFHKWRAFPEFVSFVEDFPAKSEREKTSSLKRIKDL
jgi:biotin synthesis protein BioG